MSTLMVMCALEIIGRQTIIQFLPLYNLVKKQTQPLALADFILQTQVPAPDCCTPANLYPGPNIEQVTNQRPLL